MACLGEVNTHSVKREELKQWWEESLMERKEGILNEAMCDCEGPGAIERMASRSFDDIVKKLMNFELQTVVNRLCQDVGVMD